MKKFKCSLCGYIYDEEKGIPEKGIKAGTKWEELPEDWQCPWCGAPKSAFEEIKEEKEDLKQEVNNINSSFENNTENIKKVSFGELSAICSNLAKGCDKQYLVNESKLFEELAYYFNSKKEQDINKTEEDLISKANCDLENQYNIIRNLCIKNKDRGTLRAITWGEKSTIILRTLLEKYKNEGKNFLENMNVYVCDICGFIYIGTDLPNVCPICKVPSSKMVQIKGEE